MNGQNRLVYPDQAHGVPLFFGRHPTGCAELSYFLLFSMFPLLMFVNSMLRSWTFRSRTPRRCSRCLPRSLQQLINGYLLQLSGMPSFSPMLIGIGLTLYFLSRAVRSMMRTVNDIFHVEVSRGMVREVLISLGITAGFLVSVVCSFVLVVAGRMLLRLLPRVLPVPQAALDLTRDAGFWVMIAFIFVFLMLFNRVVPNLHLKFREVWPGALFSLVAWILVSWAFSFYVDNLARYSVLYGSLGAIIVLMLWLYIVSMILLMGPQLNHTLVVMRLYRLENQRHFD